MSASDNLSTEMTAAREPGEPARSCNGILWALCIIIAIAFHAAAFAALLAQWPRQSHDVDGAPAILVELAPITAAPAPQHSDVAPGPLRADVQAPRQNPPKPPLAASVPPVIAAATASDPIPAATDKAASVKTAAQKTDAPHTSDRSDVRNRAESRASAPSVAAQQARAAAPAPGADLRDSNALPNWKSQLLAVLERNKRYPAAAQSRGDQGVAMLAFTIDRQGGVHGARIARSSGSAVLDEETLSLLQRAQPLPAPPSEIRGPKIAVVVPIRYSIR